MFITGSALAISMLAATPAYAALSSTTQQRHAAPHTMGRAGMQRGLLNVIGTVSSVNGTTLTVAGRDGVVYTVDAQKAVIHKGTETTLSAVQLQDTVMVRGVLSGAVVVATAITDKPVKRSKIGRSPRPWSSSSATFGTIRAIDGATVTIQTKNFKTGAQKVVTVTTTPATTYKNEGVSAAFTDLRVGQRVVISGVRDVAGEVIAAATNVSIVRER